MPLVDYVLAWDLKKLEVKIKLETKNSSDPVVLTFNLQERGDWDYQGERQRVQQNSKHPGRFFQN